MADTAPDRRRWWGLVAISLGVAMIIVDATVVTVAIPTMITDLGISSSQAQWVQESYAVVFAALLLVAGRLADGYGRRRMFLLGTSGFLAASLLAALAPTGQALIAARFLQGLAGALIMPASVSLINTGFRGGERARAFAVWGSTIGAAAAVGPLVGGWFTTELSWRWAFGINLPLGALVLAGALVFVAASPRAAGPVDLDPPGALLSVAGFGALAFGLIEGRSYGWWAPTTDVAVAGLSPVPLALLVAALALGGFVALAVARRRRGRPALIDLDLFSIGSFRNGNLAAAIVSLGEFGILFALPLWLQNALGYSAVQTGLLLVAMAAGSLAAGGAGAGLSRRLGPLRMVRLGIALEVAGVAGIAAVASPSTPAWPVAALLACYGVGVGLATAQVTNVVLAEVPVAASGVASGFGSTARQIGAALGIAVLGGTLFAGLAAGTRDGLAAAGLPTERVESLTAAITDSAGTLIGPLSADPATAAVAEVARAAMSTATATTALLAALVLAAGLVATLRIRPAGAATGARGLARSR